MVTSHYLNNEYSVTKRIKNYIRNYSFKKRNKATTETVLLAQIDALKELNSEYLNDIKEKEAIIEAKGNAMLVLEEHVKILTQSNDRMFAFNMKLKLFEGLGTLTKFPKVIFYVASRTNGHTIYFSCEKVKEISFAKNGKIFFKTTNTETGENNFLEFKPDEIFFSPEMAINKQKELFAKEMERVEKEAKEEYENEK